MRRIQPAMESPARSPVRNRFATQRKRDADTAYGGETSPPTDPNRGKVKNIPFLPQTGRQ